jgi:hypothetical protein
MTDRDMGNLMFLLKADDATFRHWLENCSFDDIAYANELITAYRKEKIYLEDDVDDFSLAKSVLNKFTLGNKLNNG